jgi:hypothetical protein
VASDKANAGDVESWATNLDAGWESG